MLMDQWCIICKEFTGGERYEIEVNDKNVDTKINALLCRFCYNKIVESSHHKGFFKLAKMINWVKKKDSMRSF